MIGGIIAGFALSGIVSGAIWPEKPQLYIAGTPATIGVDKVTNITFIAFGNGALVGNVSIALDGSASGNGVTDSDGLLVLPVTAKSGGKINVTASKQGYKTSTTHLTAVPGLVISTSQASITSNTATYVTFSVTGLGKPASSATINLSGAGVALEGITNSDGQIILQLNAPNSGIIDVTAKKTGYSDGSTAIISTSQQTLSVSASQSTVTANTQVYVTFIVTAGGLPVSDAKISLSGASSGSGSTNQEGKTVIQFTPQSAGTITASATATGYVGGSTSITSIGAPSLSITSNPTTLTFGVPSYVLFKVVSGGDDISEANITLSGAASGNGMTNQKGLAIILVNSTGTGTITASASKSGYSGGSATLSVTGQQTLSISASQANITNGSPAYVTFTVTSGSAAISGANVIVSGAGISIDGPTNSAGQVTLQLNASGSGTINVVARKEGYVDGLITLAH